MRILMSEVSRFFQNCVLYYKLVCYLNLECFNNIHYIDFVFSFFCFAMKFFI